MIRPADVDDAAEATELVRKSISMLCVSDHHGDRTTLRRWLANKTPKNFKEWISNPNNFCVVAEVGTKICGVGLLNKSGEVLLFYVAPGHQRLGIGRQIHDALEAQASDWSLEQMHLESTILARCFYRSLGYQPTGPDRSLFGTLRVYPIAKTLRPGIQRHHK